MDYTCSLVKTNEEYNPDYTNGMFAKKVELIFRLGSSIFLQKMDHHVHHNITIGSVLPNRFKYPNGSIEFAIRHNSSYQKIVLAVCVSCIDSM
jgi:hypothetical protein